MTLWQKIFENWIKELGYEFDGAAQAPDGRRMKTWKRHSPPCTHQLVTPKKFKSGATATKFQKMVRDGARVPLGQDALLGSRIASHLKVTAAAHTKKEYN